MRQRLTWLVMAVAAVVPAFGSSLNLATASSFGFLGGTVSNTGTSAVTGNVGAMNTISGFGASNGTATGFVCTPTSGAPCTSGNDTAVTTAYNAIFTSGAYSAAEGLTSTGSFTTATSQTFLGNTVYASSSDISTATGTGLTFNAQGDPTALFIIRVNGAFTVNGAMTFTLQNQAQADNIFWIVGNNATISVGSSGAITFDGNILAGDTFTMSAAEGGSGVLAGTINSCVFARNGNTLAGTTDVGGCAATSANGSSSVPEPGSAGLVSLGGLIGILAWRKLRVSLSSSSLR